MLIEIWLDGYSDGKKGFTAQKLGNFEATDFHDAVEQLGKVHSGDIVQVPDTDYYELNGQRLYDNEQDARASYG